MITQTYDVSHSFQTHYMQAYSRAFQLHFYFHMPPDLINFYFKINFVHSKSYINVYSSLLKFFYYLEWVCYGWMLDKNWTYTLSFPRSQAYLPRILTHTPIFVLIYLKLNFENFA